MTPGPDLGLQHILRLRPDIIKLDLELIRGIHADPARRALAGSLKAFADEIGAVVVAEGIEVRAELATLQVLACRGDRATTSDGPAPCQRQIGTQIPPAGRGRLRRWRVRHRGARRSSGFSAPGAGSLDLDPARPLAMTGPVRTPLRPGPRL